MSVFIIWYFTLMLFMVVIIVVSKYVIKADRRIRVKQIHLGMEESEMIKIMGRRYNKSLLKNNRVKYEWRYSNGGSTGNSYKGVSFRKYSGVSKVDIYCKNGFVEEVRPHNL